MDEILSLWIGIIIGFILGCKAMALKWRSNADDYKSIEYGGKLYKVLHDTDWNWDNEEAKEEG